MELFSAGPLAYLVRSRALARPLVQLLALVAEARRPSVERAHGALHRRRAAIGRGE